MTVVRFRRADGVPFRTVDDEVLLAPQGSDGFESLTGTAAVVWSLLDRTRTLPELTRELAVLYRAPRGKIGRDVRALMETLMAMGCVVEVAVDETAV
jgi:hypothetical protein